MSEESKLVIQNKKHFKNLGNSYFLREFRPNDAEEMVELYKRSITQLAEKDYSPEQIIVWLSVAPKADAFMAKYLDGRYTVIAVDGDDQIAGFSDLESDGHIDLFYVCPNHARRGIGREMLTHIVSTAEELSISKLYAEASETALSSFLRQGFEELSRRDLLINGVEIHNYAVEKVI